VSEANGSWNLSARRFVRAQLASIGRWSSSLAADLGPAPPAAEEPPLDGWPRAVWSFWSKPFLASANGGWANSRAFLCSWILSLETASRHLPTTSLVTDDAGARLLVDGLRLPFGRVSTALDALADCDPRWRALGKLHTYGLQQEPFVHVDNDVFLWTPLPDRLLVAPVLAQNPDPIVRRSFYQPEWLEAALRQSGEGWLPEEWTWYRSSGRPQRAESCGIFGGRHLDFIRHYARQAERLVRDPANQPAWRTLDIGVRSDVLAEQYFLAACVEYHHGRPDSPFRDVEIEHLFTSSAGPWSAGEADRLGYTHLIGGAKRNAAIAERLESRVERDYPDAYERCLEVVSATERVPSWEARP
jgi:hypothetical protein